MKKVNDLLENLTSPFQAYTDFILKIGLGIAFFLHGYGKLPINQGFIDWLSSQGVPLAHIIAPLVAWGEISAGIGILFGGIIAIKSQTLGSLVTRISGLAIVIIMINALLFAHSHWSIFIGERGSVLFASEQLFLLLLGFYFFIKGNYNN